MTGPEHYREAEALLEEASDPSDHGVAALHAHIGLAQVHATLALAAATALTSATIGDMPAEDCHQWRDAVATS